MKRILQNSFGKTILCLLVALVSLPAASNSDYYSKAVAKAAVGEGRVYVKYKSSATTQELNDDSNFKTEATAKSGADNQGSAPTHTYYLSAKANAGSYFVGWYNNEGCMGNAQSTKYQNYGISFEASSENSDSPTTQNWYAKFEKFSDVTFSVPEGDYYTALSVTLGCATSASGATIQYSLNNENNWQNYSTGTTISVTAKTTIYARAQKTVGGTTFNSNVYRATYNILPKNGVVFAEEISIPYGNPTPYTLTTETGTGVDVQTDGEVTATNSSNSYVATVSGSTITPAAVGTTTITVASAEGPTYLAGNGTITVNVTAPEGLTEGAPSTPETYTIPASGIGSYCSMYPLDLSESKLPSGVKAYVVWEKSETLARMTDITGSTIKGGVGFILKGEKGTVVTFSYASYSDNEPSNLLLGTLAPTYVAERTVYGLSAGKFQPNLEGVIPAHKAYLPAESNPTKALTFEFEDDPTGIDGFSFEEDTNDAIYNLSGQRIQKIQKGINIVNGKKILF